MTTRIPRTAPALFLAALAIVLLTLTLSACASSRDATVGDERIESQIASLDEALNLTDAQAERIRAILAAQDANRPSGPPPQGRQENGDPRLEMETRNAEADRQIEAVLTESQVEAYRAWRAAQPRPQGPTPRRQ